MSLYDINGNGVSASQDWLDETLTDNAKAAPAGKVGDELSPIKHDLFGWTETEQIPARYYKISFDEVWRSDRNVVSGSACISEVCFLDSEGNAKTVSSVVADSEYSTSYAASKVIDGDLSTQWSSKEVSDTVHTLEFLLNEAALITSLGIVPRPNMETGVPNNMTFYASLDGVEWIEVGVVTNQKDNWTAETWKYFDLHPITIDHTIQSVRENLDTVNIFAETDPCEISVPSELPGVVPDKENRLIIHGDEGTFGKVLVSDCENLIPEQYTLNVTSSDGVTFSSYYRYLIINGDGSGTGNAYTYITGNGAQPLPDKLKAGDTYRVLVFVNKDLPTSNIRINIDFKDESGSTALGTISRYLSTTREFTGVVPDSASKWRISFEGIARDQVWDDVRIYPILILNDSMLLRLDDNGIGSDRTITLPLSMYIGKSIIESFQYSHSYRYKIKTKDYVDNHVSSVNMTYTTPEDFGAVGDGIFDDTTSVNACIDYAFENNIPARMYKTYLVSESVKIKDGMDVYINVLKYTGNDTAVLLDCARSNIYVGRITSEAKGVTLRSDTTRVEYNLICLGYVDCKTHCISLEDTANAIFQNKFEFRYLKAGGNGCYCITNAEVWPYAKYNTENTFYGGQATNADWAFYGMGGNQKFYDIEVENDIKGGFCFINKADALIVGDRHAESSRDGEYPYLKIKTISDIISTWAGSISTLQYISPLGIKVNEIDVSEVNDYYLNSVDSTTPIKLESQSSFGHIECAIVGYGRTGVDGVTKYQKFAESALIWGNVLIFQGVPYKHLVVTENLDLRTIGETTPALPSVFEIGCADCEIYLHPTYCFMGMNKFEVIQTDTYKATIYDYYSGDVIFDGSTYGAGTFEVSTYLNGDFARIDGTNMEWSVREVLQIPSYDSTSDEGKVLKIVNGTPTWVSAG